MSTQVKRIYLSPPHIGTHELELVREAFQSNFIAPLGPMVDKFEEDFCQTVGSRYSVAVSSGTSALHLALMLSGIVPGDEVITSTLTFIASASPICYQNATPIFVDSERASWNMDPELLADALAARAKKGKLPKAVVLVHLYGQSANLGPILEVCNRYDVALIEDAAEALGATYNEKSTGTFGRFGIFSFNGNKIITTSNGGMIVGEDKELIDKARFLAKHAQEPMPHYEHAEIGYNYRLSNILAAIGIGQLKNLDQRIEQKRTVFSFYKNLLGNTPGIEFMPEAAYGRSTRWLTCVTIDPNRFGADRETVRKALEAENIEARPVWKPMHMQPVFQGCEIIGGEVAEVLFRDGLCLPSGSDLTKDDLERITVNILKCRKPVAFYYRSADSSFAF